MSTDIYVQIPAYKDLELPNTLRSLYDRATRPDDLRVRVLWQRGPEERLPSDVRRLPRLEIDEIDAGRSEGPNWARHRLQSNWAGERYTLLLDSHHRFVKSWDVTAIDMLEAIRCDGTERPILTAYLPDYHPDFPSKKRQCPYKIYPLGRENGVLMRLTSMPILGWRALHGPIPADFLSLHFLLADGRFNVDVRLNSAVYFFGDEVQTSLRAFAAGYRLFHPHRVLGWHAYDRSARTPHWDDHRDWVSRNRRSLEMLKRLYRSRLPLDGNPQNGRVADFEQHVGLRLWLQ